MLDTKKSTSEIRKSDPHCEPKHDDLLSMIHAANYLSNLLEDQVSFTDEEYRSVTHVIETLDRGIARIVRDDAKQS